MTPIVRVVTDANVQPVLAFLEARADTALFLLSNLAEHGPRLGEGMNSGTFKCVVADGEVAGVFCLTRRGNLLAETGGRTDFAEAMLEACAAEPIAVEGVVGEWRCVEAIGRRLLASGRFEERFRSRETLFRLDLPASAPATPSEPAVRLLASGDYDQFAPLHAAYMEEEGLPVQGTAAQRRATFEAGARRQRWWGWFGDGRLRAMAALNAAYTTTGQVGGVYTVPEWRRRGLARAVMRALMADAARLHGLRTLVLFTGEANAAARRLYESLGFVRTGEFGLLFGASAGPSEPSSNR